MTKQEIINRFTQENPEFTERVIPASTLSSWAEIGDLETAIRARLIRQSVEITSNTTTNTYSLTSALEKFYDVDEFPGGGVVYDGKRLDVKSMSQLDKERNNWRTSTGLPKAYVRYNEKIILDRIPDEAATIEVFCIVKPNAFTDLSATPFNELTYLTPFHYALVLYLAMRAKAKISKTEEASAARIEYENYVTWIKNEVNRGIYHDSQMRPPVGVIGGINMRSR